MNYNEVAKVIIEKVGGESNLNSFTHCATRLRFDIKDMGKVKQDDLKAMPELLGIVNKGGTFQLIVGPSVTNLYDAMLPYVTNVKKGAVVEDTQSAKTEKGAEKESILNRVMGYISGAISPVMPVLIGAGMINAILALAVLFGLSNDSGTYVTLSALANVGFTYLPVFIAFAAAKKTGTNEYLAAMISLAVIVCFNQQEAMSLFGLAIPSVKYANCIIPALFVVPFMHWVDKLFTKYLPGFTHFVIKPLLILIVVLPVELFVFGPIGGMIGTILADSCIWLMDAVGPIAIAVLAFLHPLTVITGMHYLFTPIMTNEMAELGYSFVLLRALAANFAIAGAAIAVGVKAKKASNKSIGISSGVTALISVTEPALYGCLIRLRRPLFCACAAAGVSGVFLGLFKVRAYAIASPNLFSLVAFIGGDSMMNFVLACAGAALAFALGFVFTYIAGFSED